MSQEAAPLCACGCGEPTQKSKKRGAQRPPSGWNAFVHGHHIRLNNPNASGHEPWNKGNRCHTFKCMNCKKCVQHVDKTRQFCSKECSDAYLSGERHPFWKGGVRTRYRHVWVNGHSKKEHRVIMERIMGRALKRRERVHHIDGDGLNNKPANLHLFHCEGCHQFHHSMDAPLTYIYAEVH